jgi:flavin-dependent dehydrogenase
MNSTDDTQVDVAIIGGGLAGNLLARQLKLQIADLDVAVIEKSEKNSYKVGESTIELATNYLTRKLGLSTYLYEEHLPKNGLRFFFDNEAHDGSLESLSEIGSVAMPYLPSFQTDRSRLDPDLLAMNEAAGVDVVRGRVTALELNAGDEPHLITVDGTQRRTMRARWVIDASGRAQVIAKKQGLRLPEKHRRGSVWGRFRNVKDWDTHGSPQWRGRVNNTSRMLSTNHFCYPGLWIWFIPIGQGIVSVGFVIDSDTWDDSWRTEEGFGAFLREHRAVSELLEGAELIDVMSFGQLAYRTKRYFSGDRWGLIGEAGSFADPFYSQGTDFIAIANDFVCDLVARDRAKENIAERVDLYEEFMQFRVDAAMLLYRDMYSLIGSYELFKIKWDFDAGCYYNLWLEPYIRGDLLNAEYLRTQLRMRPLIVDVLENFATLFERVRRHLHKQNRYFAANQGEFYGEFPTMRCAEGLGSDASARDSLDRVTDVYNLTRTRALALLGKPGDAAPLAFRQFLKHGAQL